MAKLKLKKLEEYLQDTDSFENPKVSLEQYPTPSHIASYMLYNMQFMYGDIENKIIGDLGSGCGVLSIGASLLGASQTIGFEIDREAIEIFRNNVVDMEIPSIDIVQINVLNGLKDSRWTNIFDTIVMNPPFGTKNNAGMDIKFLETAINLSNNAVYSLHKTSTREYISKKSKELKCKAEVVAELRYNIDSLYKFHKKSSIDIEVDFWRFDTSNKDNL